MLRRWYGSIQEMSDASLNHFYVPFTQSLEWEVNISHLGKNRDMISTSSLLVSCCSNCCLLQKVRDG